MTKRTLAIAVVVLASRIVSSGVAEAADVTFTQQPTATVAGESVVIAFAVSGPTDVAVYVNDSQGKVIRHLAAGVLGENAPSPFQAGSLSQKIAWDGKADYGREAKGGPFTVRVALGLGARFDKVIQGNRPHVKGAYSIAAHGSSVYVIAAVGESVFGDSTLIEFAPEGTYRRMLKPFPSDLPFERVKSFGALQLDGKPLPAIHGERLRLYPGNGTLDVGLTISPDGRHLCYVQASQGAYKRQSFRICSIDTDGGSDQFQVVLKPEGEPKSDYLMGQRSRAALAFSSDGKSLYLCGLRGLKEKTVYPAVYKVRFPERDQPEPFFGDPASAGADKTHLAHPWGLATDGTGHLLVTDHKNDRVVVLREKDGTFVSEFSVSQPQAILVDRETAAVYITSGKANARSVRLLKYTSWKKPTLVCEATVTTRGWKNHHSIAVTRSSEGAPVVWLATRDGCIALFEDTGEKFSEPRFISRDVHSNGGKGEHTDVAYFESYNNLVVDRKRKEVYASVRGNGMRWVRYNESKDELGYVNWTNHEATRDSGGVGLQIVPHPDDFLFSLSWPFNFHKWDRRGKPIPFEHRIVPTMETMKDHAVGKTYYSPERIEQLAKKTNYSFVPVSMVENPHTLGVRWSDGHLFMFSQTHAERNPKILREFLPNGKLVSEQPIIWQVSDTVVGPKFDAAGNIYLADAIRPANWQWPDDLEKAFEGAGVTDTSVDNANGFRNPDWRVRMAVHGYGSIVKFSPQGGMIDYAKSPYGDSMTLKPYGNKVLEESPDLPKDMKRIDAAYIKQPPWPQKQYGATTIGAEWIAPGVGHMGPWRCNCESITFDVDEFGRTFFPDFSLYRIRVLDTGGNAVTHFGNYGNADTPRDTNKVRSSARDIGLAWPVGVGVTDDYVYIGDTINRRMIRAKLTYDAEATCPVPLRYVMP